MTEEQFIERHIAVCSAPNTRKRKRPGGKNHGGGKRSCARHIWREIQRYGLDPIMIVRGSDLQAAIAQAKDGNDE